MQTARSLFLGLAEEKAKLGRELDSCGDHSERKYRCEIETASIGIGNSLPARNHQPDNLVFQSLPYHRLYRMPELCRRSGANGASNSVKRTARHERILLTALAVLLPDFRYVLKTYLDAVTELQRYKPPVFPFAKAKVASKHPSRPAPRTAAEAEHSGHAPSTEPTATELFSNFRLIVDAELAKANSIISEKVSNVTRDMTRPLVETSNQIQQLTIGTDLTLRKNVLVAAITIFLSLLGYFASAAGEAGIGCVVVMIATLLPSAILAPRRHELLILINDSRVALSLLGTLAAVLCAFIPLTAAYFFFGSCVGLVAVRAPMYRN